MTQQKLQILLCCNPGTFSLELVLLLFYLECKIVRTCDFFHYLTTINLETIERLSSLLFNVLFIIYYVQVVS